MLLTAFCKLNAQYHPLITMDCKGLPFEEFVTRAESMLPVRFFYREEWVRDLIVGEDADSIALDDLLERIFFGTSLYFLIEESGNIVITKNFAVKISPVPSGNSDVYLPADNGVPSGKQQPAGIVSVEIGNPAEKNRPGNVIVSGYILDTETKEPIPGATVFIKKLATGAISNEFGYFTLTLSRGPHLFQFSSIGMGEKTISANINGAGELNVEMQSAITPLKEVVVTADKSVTLQRFEVGAEKMNMTSFKLLPTSLGEADIIKSILLIPGVQSVGEGAAGFNVRGGSSDQNLILLYGAPVYNSSHFFGFFSAVNSEIIRDVTLYKGGIPGRYGGRISSVLDIVSKEGNRNEFSGKAGISPVTTHIMVEGPVIKDTLTYLLAARTTYSNWIMGLLPDEALQASKAFFYDLNGKMTYDVNKKNKIDLSAYYSHDSFRFNTDSVYSYDNSIVALKWRHFFNNRFFSSFSINNSHYQYDIATSKVPEEAFELSHKVNSTGIKADFNKFLGKQEVNFGIDLTRYAIQPGSYLPNSDSSLIIPTTIEKERALEGSIYFEDKFMLTKFLSIQAGVRISSYFYLGPQAVIIYDPAFSKGSSTITDTLGYKTAEVIKRYGGPEFRLSLNFRITDRNSIKINYNRTRQYLHLLSNSTSISPTDTWKLCDYYLKPQKGDQVAAGFYQLFAGNRFEFSAEVYYKDIRNMVDFKGGTDLVMNDNIEQDVVDARGRAYGMELVLRKNEGKVRYTLGYTYARTLLKTTGNFKEETINAGEWFPASYDKPHDLSVTFNYLFSRRFSFSSSYTYSTGRPITFPVSMYPMYDNLLIHYSDRNKYRIPDYSRLDISLKISGNLRSNKIAHPSLTFSVYNLLGRQNVYSIYFRKEEDMIKGYKLSIFGVAIPSVTFSFDF